MQTDEHRDDELHADWQTQREWTKLIRRLNIAKMNYHYADWRTEKMNYTQTDEQRRWTIRRLTNTEKMNEQKELRWHRRQGREMGSGQGKKRNEDRNGVGGSESYGACKCYVTAEQPAWQPAKLVLNKDSIQYKSMLGDRRSTEKRPRTCPIPDIFWNVTH